MNEDDYTANRRLAQNQGGWCDHHLPEGPCHWCGAGPEPFEEQEGFWARLLDRVDALTWWERLVMFVVAPFVLASAATVLFLRWTGRG